MTMRWDLKKISWLAWLWFGIILIVALISLPNTPRSETIQNGLAEAGNTFLKLLIALSFPLVGALIITFQPQNTIGWLLMLPGLAVILDPFTRSQITGLAIPPAHPSILFWIAVYLSNTYWLFAIFPIFFIALLFPTGKPLSTHWRWASVLAIGLFVSFFAVGVLDKTLTPDFSLYGVEWSIPNPIGFLEPSTIEALLSSWIAGMIGLTLLCVISIVLRYKRAQKVERKQVKWLLYAVGMFVTVYAISLLAQNWGQANILSLFSSLFMLGIPVAIGISILRYRLWDIDVIIRKTLQYILLTGLLALVYYGSVVLLQSLAKNLTGDQSPVVVVLSTLGIAALFNPLRKRTQDFIDRRFYRQKYDAEKALAEFAAAARQETDLTQLTDQLTKTVQETIQPTQTSVWLRK